MGILYFLAGLYTGPGIVITVRNFRGGLRNGVGPLLLIPLILLSVLLGVLWLLVWAVDRDVFQRAMRG